MQFAFCGKISVIFIIEHLLQLNTQWQVLQVTVDSWWTDDCTVAAVLSGLALELQAK